MPTLSIPISRPRYCCRVDCGHISLPHPRPTRTRVPLGQRSEMSPSRPAYGRRPDNDTPLQECRRPCTSVVVPAVRRTLQPMSGLNLLENFRGSPQQHMGRGWKRCVASAEPTDLIGHGLPPIPPFDKGGSGGIYGEGTACPKRSPEHALGLSGTPVFARMQSAEARPPNCTSSAGRGIVQQILKAEPSRARRFDASDHPRNQR